MFFNKVESITVQQLKQKLNDDIHLIDVREPYEFEREHIQQAINIPLSALQQFNGDKDITYYIICKSGNRSKKATQFLNELGYKAINVTGGMNHWTELMKN